MDPEYEQIVENEKLKTIPKTESISLGDLLECLDGIIENHGRMIIMTTNHPEQIDDALLRPGRIDNIIEFTNLSRKDTKQMYSLWFDKEIPDTVYNNMKDRVYSQANIGKLFGIGDLEIIHKHLSDNTMCD